MAVMLVMATRNKTTDDTTSRLLVSVALSQMKIQLKFSRKLIDKVMRNHGLAMGGLRYSLPSDVVMNIDTMKNTIEAAKQKNMMPHKEKVNPEGVMYNSYKSLISPTVEMNISGIPTPEEARALNPIISRYVINVIIISVMFNLLWGLVWEDIVRFSGDVLIYIFFMLGEKPYVNMVYFLMY